MKVKKSEAVGFLVVLGFSKAPDWEDEKIEDRIKKIPSRVKPEQVTKEFESLYGELCANEDGGVTLITEEPVWMGPRKKKAKTKSPPMKKKKSVAPEQLEFAQTGPVVPKEKLQKKVAKKIVDKKEPTSLFNGHKLDSMGCRIGTISASVNGVLDKEWKDREVIAKEAGVTEQQVHFRLYNAAREGLVEYRRLVQYRLVPKEK